jgi:PAS domain S-box-containing protein
LGFGFFRAGAVRDVLGAKPLKPKHQRRFDRWRAGRFRLGRPPAAASPGITVAAAQPGLVSAELAAAVAREMVVAADLATVGTTVTRRAAEWFKADAVLLHLARTPGGQMEVVAADGMDARSPQGAMVAAGRLPNWVINSPYPFISNDTRRDPRVIFLGRGPRHLSVMYAPFHISAPDTDGALVVCTRRSHAFATAQLTLLRSLADQAAVAIANALLVADAERRADLLERVSRAGQRIASHLAEVDVLAVSSVELTNVFDIAHATVVAFDAAGRIAHEAHAPPAPLCPVQDLTWLRSLEHTLVLEDLRGTEILPDVRLRLLERGVHSVLAAPIASDGVTLGAMLLYATGGRGQFTREARELAGILAGQTAVALRHARLYQATVAARQHGEAILQSSFTAIITADPALRVRETNAAAAELLGQSGERLRGRHLPEVLGAEAWAIVAPALEAAQRTGVAAPPVEAAVPSVTRAGPREVLLGVAPLPEGCVVSMADITRLKDLDRLKSELVASVSHDLKAPLATIRAYTELLLEGLDGEDPALRQTFLRYVDAEVERLNGYITNMLDLERIEAQAFQLRTERLWLHELVQDAVSSVRPRSAARDIAVDVTPPPGPVAILADRHMLRAAVVNILDNAVKFSPEGGRVLVRAAQDASGVQIAIQDFGPGIPAEVLPHVFDKFFRASAHVEGTGLGLVIARRAAQAHGGDVTVVSATGQGSTFTISLPPSVVLGAAADPLATAAVM